MTTSFVQIAGFASPFEAEHLRAVLAQEGIASFIEGAHTATTLSHLSIGIGGARLYVASEDAAKAQQIIHSVNQAEKPTSSGWHCGACDEDVDAGFDVCWSCGRVREEVEQRKKETGSVDDVKPQETLSDDQASIEHPPSRDKSVDAYARPSKHDRRPNDPLSQASAARQEETDALLLRAFRAALIGLVVLPILLNFYSMYLLVRASCIGANFSAKGARRFYTAWVLNIVSCFVWGSVLTWL